MVSAEDVARSAGGYVCRMQPWKAIRARIRETDPLTRDILLAAAFFAESQLEVALLVGYGTPNAGLAAALLAMQALGLALRRVEPLTCVVLTMVPWAVLQ